MCGKRGGLLQRAFLGGRGQIEQEVGSVGEHGGRDHQRKKRRKPKLGGKAEKEEEGP